MLPASRFPQSRRLRLGTFDVHSCAISRLKIPAVAATAAERSSIRRQRWNPPQDSRSRGDCGLMSKVGEQVWLLRLKIPAVAATAAWRILLISAFFSSRLKIPAVAATAALINDGVV